MTFSKWYRFHLFTVLALVSSAVFIPSASSSSALAITTSRFAGIVRSTTTDVPLPGVTINIFPGTIDQGFLDVTAPDKITTTTSPIGGYSVDLDGGCYTAQFVDPAGQFALAVDYFCVQPGYDELFDVAMDDGGTISGTVLDASNNSPIANACVSIIPSVFAYGVTTQACTDVAGRYKTVGLAHGNYNVWFNDPTGSYQSEYYNHTQIYQAAATVVVNPHADTTAINASLTPVPADSVRISGTISADGTGVPIGACIDIFSVLSTASWNGCTPTGVYQSAPLPPGDYNMYVSSQDGSYFAEYFDNAASPSAATTITLAGVSRTINVGLARAGSITGHVVDANSLPATGANVTVCSTPVLTCQSTLVDGAGAYLITGFTTGQYTVQFGGNDSWVTQYFDNSATLAGSTPVAITAGSETSSINATLSSTAGAISGRVTAAATAAPIAGAAVDVFVAGQTVPTLTVATDVNGNYRLTPLDPATYVVSVAAIGYVSESYDNVGYGATNDTLVAVTTGVTATGKDFALDVESAIEGVVLPSAPAPLGQHQYCVTVAPTTGAPWTRSDCANFGGRYHIGKLPAGSYTVRFDSDAFVSQYFSNQPSAASSQPVVVGTGATATANATLTRRGAISGLITDQTSGLPVANTTVFLTDALDVFVGSTNTDDLGRYTFAVPDGTYLVSSAGSQVVLGQAFSRYSKKYFANSPTAAGATVVSAAIGVDQNNVNIALDRLPTISGTVTDAATGLPIPFAFVGAGTSAFFLAAYAYADVNGAYSIPVTPGTYKVEFSASGYSAQWFDHQTSNPSATPVIVTSSTSAANVNGVLDKPATISGLVTDSASAQPISAQVYAYDSSGAFVASTSATSNGRYALTVPTGSYRLQFNAATYASEYYNNVATLAAATSINVTAGATLTGYDAALAKLESISGRVTDAATGLGVQGYVYTLTQQGSFVAFAFTSPNGDYTVYAAPGTYRLQFNATGYVSEYFDNTTVFAGATPVILNSGDALVGFNATLDRPATISGTLRDTATGLPISGTVNAGTINAVTSSAFAGPDGHYTLTVPAGTYGLQFNAPGYVSEYFDNATVVTNATPVSVTPGAALTGYNASLDRLPSISGRLTDAATGLGVQGYVYLYSSTGVFVSFTSTNANGDYTVYAPAGDYRLSLNAFGYLSQYWNNVTQFGDATPINLLSGAALTGYNASLIRPGTISGTLTDAVTGLPISGFVAAGVNPTTAVATAFAGADGHYTLTVPPGTYGIQFSSTGHVSEYFNNTTDVAAATPIVVGSGATLVGYDAALAQLESISGRLTDSATGLGAQGYVFLYSTSGAFVASASTDANGNYTVYASPGDYRLLANASGYVSQYFNDVTQFANATPITLSAGEARLGVDAVLVKLGSISGRITNGATGLPISAEVIARDLSGSAVGVALTGVDGMYHFDLAPGTYTLEFFTTDLGTRYFANSTTLAGATPIIVASGSALVGYDIVFSNQADVAVYTAVSRDPIAVGDPAYLVAMVQNLGPDVAHDVVFTDVVPAGFTISSIDVFGGATCSSTGQTVTCAGPPNLSVGTQAYAQINVVADAVNASAVNTLSYTTTAVDPNASNDTASATFAVVANTSDVSVFTGASRGQMVVGETDYFYAYAQNNGPGIAHNVTFTDVVPDGFTIDHVDGINTAANCVVSGQSVTCTAPPTLDPFSYAFAYIYVVPTIPAASASNTVSYTSSAVDPNSANDTATTSVSVVAATADISVFTGVDRSKIALGDPGYLYAFATNNGPAVAHDVVFTDAVPDSLAIDHIAPSAGTTCVVSGQSVTCTAPAVLAQFNQAYVYIYVVGSALTGAAINTVSVTSTSVDLNPLNDAASKTVAVVANESDISVFTGASRSHMVIGEPDYFYAFAQNNGPAYAHNVVFTDVVPIGIAIDHVVPSSGTSCAVSGQTVTCTAPAVLGLFNQAYAYVYVVPSVVTPSATNGVSYSAGLIDPNAANNIASVTVAVLTNEADVSVYTSASRSQMVVSEPDYFNTQVYNGGPAVAHGVVFTDVVPAGLTIDHVVPSFGTTCAIVGQSVTCNAPIALSAFGSAYATIYVVGAAVTASATNTVSYAASSLDPNSANDSASVTVSLVANEADVSVATGASRSQMVVSEPDYFYAQVYNSGPAVAHNVVFTDVVPAGLTIDHVVTFGATCVTAGQTVTCTAPAALPPGQFSYAYIYVVGATSATSATNTVSYTSSSVDPNGSNDTASVTVSVVANEADVSVSTSSSRSQMVVGESDYFFAQVYNGGPAVAHDVVFTDVVPTGLTIDHVATSGATCVVSGQTVTCTASPLLGSGSGAYAYIYVLGAVPTATATNAVSYTSSSVDPNAANDSASVTVSVVANEADVSVSTSSSRSQMVVGESDYFFAQVYNGGPAIAHDVVFTDVVPAGLTIDHVAASGAACVVSTQTVMCTASPLLGPGGSAYAYIYVGGAAPTATAVNAASYTSSSVDPNATNDTASVAVSVVANGADISVSTGASRSQMLVDETDFFYAQVYNGGPAVAHDVAFTDVVPDGLSIDHVTTFGGTNCVVSGQTVTCTGPANLSVGSTAYAYIYVLGVAPNASATNSVSSTTSSVDPNSTNDTASVTVTVEAHRVDLEAVVSNNQSQSVFIVGESGLFTIMASNHGPGSANDTVLVDHFPSEVLPTAVTFETSPGACSIEPDLQTVSCNFGTLAAGASAYATVSVSGVSESPVNGLGQPLSIQNAVSVTSSTPEVAVEQFSNTSQNLFFVLPDVVDLQANVFTIPHGHIGVVQQLHLQAFNGGFGRADGVSIDATVPPEFSINAVTGATSGVTCDPIAGNTIHCGTPSLGRGATVDVVVDITPVLASAAAVNSVTVSAPSEVDSFLGNNTAEFSSKTSHAPTVTLSVDPASGVYPLDVLATVNAIDLDGDPLTYDINWGDGASDGGPYVPGATVAHTYLVDGLFTPIVQVFDGGPTAGRDSATVNVSLPTPLTANAGPDVATASNDPAGVTLDGSTSSPAAAITTYSWRVFGTGFDQTFTGAVVKHLVLPQGTYLARLTVQTATATATDDAVISIGLPAVGLLVSVVDDPSGAPIGDADVAVVAADGTKYSALSDATSGSALLLGLPNGTYTLYAAKNGFTPNQVNVVVTGGADTSTISMHTGEIAAAVLEAHRLTASEAIAAGIDPTLPANNNVVRFDINLAFLPDAPPIPFQGYITGNGFYRATLGFGFDGVCTVICRGVVPIQVGGGPGVGLDISVSFVSGQPQIIYMVIPIKAKWLKEFYDVSMTVQNLGTPGFVLSGGSALLDLPTSSNGVPALGLPALSGQEQQNPQTFPDVPGGQSKAVHWIVRGDQPGLYSLTAHYSGVLDPVSLPVSLTATTATPIKVWGINAVRPRVVAEDHASNSLPYNMTIELCNVTDSDPANQTPVYNLSLELMADGAAHMIYQGGQSRLYGPYAQIEPGQCTPPAHVTVFPDFSGTLLIDQSYVELRGAGAVSRGADFLTSVPETTFRPQLVAQGGVRRVTLTWDPVPGDGAGYEVWKTVQTTKIDPHTLLPYTTWEMFGNSPIAVVGPGVYRAVVAANNVNVVTGEQDVAFYSVRPIGGETVHPLVLGATNQGSPPTFTEPITPEFGHVFEIKQSSASQPTFDVAASDPDGEIVTLTTDPPDEMGHCTVTSGGPTPVGLTPQLHCVFPSDSAARSITFVATDEVFKNRSLRKVYIGGRYIGLGDSYSSGEGAVTPFDYLNNQGNKQSFMANTDIKDVDACHRSFFAYFFTVSNSSFVPSTSDFHACSGAVTANILSTGQWSAPDAVPQIDTVPPDATVITLSIGGNDADFAGVVANCVTVGAGTDLLGNFLSPPLSWLVHATNYCQQNHSKRTAELIDGLKPGAGGSPSKLEQVYTLIHERAPHAQVYVVGYPKFFGFDPVGLIPPRIQTSCSYIQPFDQLWLNSKVSEFNGVIQDNINAVLDQTGSSGNWLHYVDVENALQGHEICAPIPFMNGFHLPLIYNKVFAFHPNILGQAEFAKAVLGVMSRTPAPQTFTVVQGQSTSTTTQVGSGSSVSFSTTWPGSDVVLSVTAPSGRRITRGTVASDVVSSFGPTNENITVTNPETGTWTVELFGAQVAPQGELVQLQIETTVPSPIKPTARVTQTVDANNPASVSFSGLDSSAGEGTISSYSWIFGDGAMASGATALHTYTRPGSYEAALVVTNSAGESNTAMSTTVLVDGVSNTPPTAIIDVNQEPVFHGSTLTATVSNVLDLEGDLVHCRFIWTVNDVVQRETAPGGCLSDTFDLATPGQELRGDVVGVSVVPSDLYGDGPSSSTTVTISNAIPVTKSDAYAVLPDHSLVVTAPGVLTNDSDADATDVLSAAAISPPTNGSLVLGTDGSFTYVPQPGFQGVDTFTYDATDQLGATSLPTLVTITVDAANDPPVAVGDNYTVAEDQQLSVASPGVLGNDTDPDSPVLTAQLGTTTAHGVLALDPSGSFMYTPDANYFGPDSFTYTASDGLLSSPPATVLIDVTPVNDAPVAAPSSYSTPEDTELTIAAPGVLGSVTDVDSATLTAIMKSGATHGNVVLNLDGSFTYTPALNFNGQDSFTYVASDGSLLSNEETVTIDVTPVNDAPVAVDDTFAVTEDVPLTVSVPGVLVNDTDPDSALLTAQLVTNALHGTLTLDPNGSFVYLPNPNYNGPDSFTYSTSDGLLSSSPATVSINVAPVNDAPVAVDDSYVTNEDFPITIAAPGVLGNDSDIDSALLTAAIGISPTHGQLSLAADGSFTYTPDANFNGPDTFTYRVSDGAATSNEATVSLTVTAVNDAPVAAGESYSVAEDGVLAQGAPGVLANDTDVDSAVLTAQLVVSATHGALTFDASGSFVYVPDANYAGTDAFTYTVSDGQLSSSLVTTTIDVTPVNDAPVAADNTYAMNEDTPLTITAPGVLGNDSDIDSATLTAVIATGPTNGSLTLNPNGSFTYTPNANFNGSDAFTYRASDGALTSNLATVTLTVNAVNDAPVAVGDSYTVAEDGSLAQLAPGVLNNDSDVDSSVLTAQLVSTTTHGLLTLDPSGSFTYAPAANFNGPDSFTYTVSDGFLTSSPATVLINVTPVNDAPVAQPDSYTAIQDNTLTIVVPGVLANDTDIDSATLTAAVVAGPANGSLTLNPNGSFTYAPVAGFSGSDSFTYAASDGLLASLPVVVTLTVLPAPNTSIDAAPPAVTQLRTASISFSSNDPLATFECRLDAGAFATCTSPLTLTALVDGSHTESVRAISNHGVVDPTPASVTWVVDGTAPVITIVTPSQNAVFTVGQIVTPVASCTDNRDPSPILVLGTVDTSTATVTPRTFTATCTDSVGNAQTVTRSYTVTAVVTNTRQVRWSSSTSRSASQLLDGSTVKGSIAIFLTDANAKLITTSTGVRSVRFRLISSTGKIVFQSTDTGAPYDAGGTTLAGSRLVDTREWRNGTYRFETLITPTTGATTTLSATVTVFNIHR